MLSAKYFTKTSRSSSSDTVSSGSGESAVDIEELVRKRDVLLKVILFNSDIGGPGAADVETNVDSKQAFAQSLEFNENLKLFQIVHGDLDANKSLLKKYFDCFKQTPAGCIDQMFASIGGFTGKLVTVYLILQALDELNSAEMSDLIVDAELEALGSLLYQLVDNSDEFSELLNRFLAKPVTAQTSDGTKTVRNKSTSQAFLELFDIRHQGLFVKRANLYKSLLQVLLRQLVLLADYNLENRADVSKRLVLAHRLKYDKLLQKWRTQLVKVLTGAQDLMASLSADDDEFSEDILAYKSLDHNLFNWHLFLILTYLRQRDQNTTSPALRTDQSDEDITFNDYLLVFRFEVLEASSSSSSGAKSFWLYNRTLYRVKSEQEDDSIKNEYVFKLKANLAVKFLLFVNEWYDIKSSTGNGDADPEDELRITNQKCFLINLRQFYNLPLVIEMLNYLTYSNGSAYDVIRVRYRLKLINLIINLLSYQIYRLKLLVGSLSALSDKTAPVSASLTAIEEYLNANKPVSKKINDFLVVTQYLIEMIQTFSNTSIKFSLKFHNKFMNSLKAKLDIKDLKFYEYGVECLFSLLNNDALVDFFGDRIYHISQLANSSAGSHVELFAIVNTIFNGVLGAILNLSPCVDKFKKIWDENLDSLNTCIRISTKFGRIDDYYRLCAYMIVANIANDKQLDELTETDQVIQSIVDLIVSCISPLRDGVEPKRQKIQINDDDDDVTEVLVTSGQSNHPAHSTGQETEACEDIECHRSFKSETLWNIIELLKALYKLSINDKIKGDLYSKYSMRDHLKVLLARGNEAEKEFTLGLLCQLSFNETIVQDIRKDTELIDCIASISKNENGQFKRSRLVKNASNIVFLLNKNQEDYNAPNRTGTNQDPTAPKDSPPSNQAESSSSDDATVDVLPSKRHIMISYNRDSRDLCLSIKANLEKLGYTIWIDVQDIRGSSLESMAQAVEESSVVLICMTQKYKLSANCRLEAEYTMNLNKPFVPLILQKDYKPDGWLGLILGTKMFVNYTKYEFSVCMGKLVAEIVQIHKDLDKAYYKSKKKLIPDQKPAITDQPKPPVTDKPDEKPDSKSPTLWSKAEVAQWLDKNQFHPSIVVNLSDCDGKLLHQIYRLRQQAPEFFFQTLRDTSQKEAMLLKDLALFIYELEHLFLHS